MHFNYIYNYALFIKLYIIKNYKKMLTEEMLTFSACWQSNISYFNLI